MSSATSTDPGPAPARDTGFQAWHVYTLLSMVAATVAVMLSRQTHPIALLVLSGAVLAAGLVGWTLHRALLGFSGLERMDAPLAETARTALERDKALLLRSIKELEFDRAMGKVSEPDYQMLNGGLRTRAVALMRELERGETPAPSPVVAAGHLCGTCRRPNDADANFCKTCGAPLRPSS